MQSSNDSYPVLSESDETPAIKVEHLSKTFKLPHERHSSIKSSVVNFAHHQKGYEIQQALKNISFEVKKGEFFGIVGRNGSGKSTLLKILAGIYTPDKGSVQVNGKLTPFIELGVGFNPELTGRENVYLNGSLLGFNRKEMDAMYNDIVEFAELGRFMDQRLKNYSSGMQVRLAFSIAIRSKGDILLLDEVLAVGDEAFQTKCFDYFKTLKENRQTVILVTHDMGNVVKFCDRVMVLDKSEQLEITDPKSAADTYMKLNQVVGNSPPAIKFFSHQLDATGAPRVFVDMIKEFRQSCPSLPFEFHTFTPVVEENLKNLQADDIKVNVHENHGQIFSFSPGDVVIFNTVAVPYPLRSSVFLALGDRTVRKLIWYIHEDYPNNFLGHEEIETIKELLRENKITIYTAAKKTQTHYRKLLGSGPSIKLAPYKLVMPEDMHIAGRNPKDFEKLNFMITGSLADARKGQIPIVYAFLIFLQKYYKKAPENYRDFTLTYIGVMGDYASREVMRGATKLGDRFRHYPIMTHDEVLKHIKQTNVTVCYSIAECLPIFVFEGMIAGHPILRNDCSGMEEQLRDGENGLYLDSTDINQVANTLEKILNKRKTSDKDLAQMSLKAYETAKSFEEKNYKPILDEVTTHFKHTKK